MEQATERYIETLRRKADEAIEQVDLLTAAFSICESPIEERLLLAYLQEFPATAHYDGHANPIFIDEDLTDKKSWVMFIPQFAMHFGKKHFRADFLFLQLVEDAENERVNDVKKVVVEVDGHDFHERTKEQARNDRSRDRFMLREGFYVLRYTGSEVFNNPYVVAREIREFVMLEAAA